MSDARVNFDLTKIGEEQQRLMKPVFHRIGLHCMREAKGNAPRSPNVGQISATLVRKRRTKRRVAPGGLEKSIAHSVERTKGEIGAHIFVARNSAAGAYANYIHNLKNIKWFKRGAGTVAKGARADEKFIERAVKDNMNEYQRLIEKAVEQATKAR